MGVIDTLKNIADGADAFKRIHDTGRMINDQYITPVVKSKPQPHPLTIHVPDNTKVGEPVTISGTGTGLITLYSPDYWKIAPWDLIVFTHLHDKSIKLFVTLFRQWYEIKRSQIIIH